MSAPVDKHITSSEAQAPEDNDSLDVPPELRCSYPSKVCVKQRAAKRSGELHRFCEFHRRKANLNQQRLQQRRKFKKQHSGTSAAPTKPVVKQETRRVPQLSMVEELEQTNMYCPIEPFHSPVDVHAHHAYFGHIMEPYQRPVAVQVEDLHFLQDALFDQHDWRATQGSQQTPQYQINSKSRTDLTSTRECLV
ncbi:TPA: hypothetical protein N0F65_000913 [Lagenidium giganteum]|uniref:Uncharacterized protein n=1 Tax=Lagenidium giganteum TaxID=4803 RepID=A0AAV2YNY1_9STRA|nr:TPA: hypothetical protein N0F65_000913 [Lagenidium giganteum]